MTVGLTVKQIDDVPGGVETIKWWRRNYRENAPQIALDWALEGCDWTDQTPAENEEAVDWYLAIAAACEILDLAGEPY